MADTNITYEKGKLYQIDLVQLQRDPNQPRKYMDPAAGNAQQSCLEPAFPLIYTYD